VRIQDDTETRTFRSAIDERARLAAGLEPFHRKTRPDEVQHEIERPVQVIGTVSGRRHGQRLGCRDEERLGFHATILHPYTVLPRQPPPASGNSRQEHQLPKLAAK